MSFEPRPAGALRGGEAEELAARHLRGRGYRILARNVKSKVGEIDVVALDRGVLCFVEVRQRRDRTAAESVGAEKRRRLSRAAEQYLIAHGKTDAACRFDVVTVTGGDIEIIKDAF
jgi:putative endonuclease